MGSLAKPRTLDRFAIVYVVAGAGRYDDGNGCKVDVEAGTLLLIFPGLAHRYGPMAGQTWEEFFLLFSGPAFDVCVSSELIGTSNPVGVAVPVQEWFERCLSLVSDIDLLTLPEKVERVGRLQAMLANVFANDKLDAESDHEPRWLASAKRLLRSDLASDVPLAAVAERVGLSYESFRKQFAAETGVSPGQYRTAIKMRSAADLLATTGASIKQIAAALGFSDEFHFSHRFKQTHGIAPGAYRQRCRR